MFCLLHKKINIKMYIPRHTLLEDKEKIFEFIEKNSFATLVTVNKGKINATHIPVLLDKNGSENGILYCHISKANEQWKDFDREALVIFQGAHHYISSSWYETDQSVPTWNYISVHVYGEIEIIKDTREKIKSVKDLVKYFEEEESSYKTENLTKKYFEGLLKGIVAFKIIITGLEGKQKLSQNHSEERQARVIKELEKSTDKNAKIIAELMKENYVKKNNY